MLYIFSNHPHAVDSEGVWRWFIRSGPDSKTIALLETRQQILETTAVGWCYMCRTHVRYSSASSSALLNTPVLENSCHTRQGSDTDNGALWLAWTNSTLWCDWTKQLLPVARVIRDVWSVWKSIPAGHKLTKHETDLRLRVPGSGFWGRSQITDFSIAWYSRRSQPSFNHVELFI